MNKETKAEKFKRLAERRTGAVLEGIRKLARLANSRAYEFTPEQVERIFRTIEGRLELARRRFDAEEKFSGSKEEKFTL